MTDFPLFAYLNPRQQLAVTAGDGHLCINAAAGTGKTSTVAARILYLQLKRGAPPGSILAVSFSRAARGNLLQRMEEYIRLLGRGSYVSTLTLHGLAFRVLRMAAQNGETWLKPGFKIVNAGRGRLNPLFEEYGARLVSDLRDEYPLDSRPALYSRALDLIRQGHPDLQGSVIGPEELDPVKHGIIRVNWDGGSRSPLSLAQVQTVWKRYNRLLQQQNSIDYAGMLSECLSVLYCEGATLESYQKGLRYLIVDEYQDTSRTQDELVRILAGETVSVNVVGDSDQAIYAFNGSDVANIGTFASRMSEGPIPVLDSIDLTWNYRSTGNILAAAARVLAAAKGRPKVLEPAPVGVSDSVLAYRARNLPVVRVLARELDMAARWVAEEIDRLVTEEDIRPEEIAVLVRKDTEHSEQGTSVKRALAGLGLTTQVQDRDPERTALVMDALHTFLNERFSETLSDVIGRVKSGACADELPGITSKEALAVLEEARKAGAASALEAADMVYDMGAPDQTGPDITGVQIRTIHSAKGLEFRVVFLMYLADKEFPSGSRPDLAEERRLVYVGITRAMERLYVLGRPGVCFPSFFDEIDGPGVELVRAEAPDQVQGAPEVDTTTRDQVAAARQRQKELEEQRRQRRKV